MPYRSLADFLEDLAHSGSLLRIDQEFQPRWEVAAATAELSRRGNQANLFANISDCQAAVVTNLLASPQHVLRALAAKSLDEVAGRVGEFLQQNDSRGWLRRMVGSDEAALRWQPKLVKSGLCQQTVRLGDDVDLRQLPLLTAWTADVGPSISLAPLITISANSEQSAACGYDLLVLDRMRLAVFWQLPDVAARQFEEYRRQAKPMPVAIALGGDPSLRLITSCSLTREFDGLVWSGMLRGQPLDVVRGKTIDLRVPADADVVIEGVIDPSEPFALCGPLGSETGYARMPTRAPVIHVRAITQRANPILPLYIPGLAGGELPAMRAAMERICLPLVQAMIPDLVDLHRPGLGGDDGLTVVSIDKLYAAQALHVAHACWSWPPLMHAKVLIVVDAAVNVRDLSQVWSAVATSVAPGRDTPIVNGAISLLDHAAPTPLVGGKLLLDATTKLPGEHSRAWPEKNSLPDDVLQSVRAQLKLS